MNDSAQSPVQLPAANAEKRKHADTQLSDICDLLRFYLNCRPDVLAAKKDTQLMHIQDRCIQLMERDYVVDLVRNDGSDELCATYPAQIVVMQRERSTDGTTWHSEQHESSFDSGALQGQTNPRTSALSTLLRREQSTRTSSSTNATTVIDPCIDEVTGRRHDNDSLATENALRQLSRIAPPTDQDNVVSSKINDPSDNECRDMPPTITALKHEMTGLSVARDESDECGGMSTAMSPHQDCEVETPPVAESIATAVGEEPNGGVSWEKLFRKSRFARVRGRFVVPVILCRGKNICRSGTLSHEAEVLLNTLNEKTRSFWYGQQQSSITSQVESTNAVEQTLMQKQRTADIELMQKLRIKYICDLMVEHRKVKYGLTVSSSEKADSMGRYSNAGFRLISLPYPGVEFFRQYKDNKYCGRELYFDWSQGFADATLSLPDDCRLPGIAWSEYKTWDLVLLTKNYLRQLLSLISKLPGESNAPGLLVHCISGWDRTPLVISLLRLSLWADGEVHASLTPAEILYLTVGYDWLLFNHLLADRTQRGEDIFYFCFYFLQFLTEEEFCVKIMSPSPVAVMQSSASVPPPSSASYSKSWQFVHDHAGSPSPQALPGTSPAYRTRKLSTCSHISHHDASSSFHYIGTSPSDISSLADVSHIDAATIPEWPMDGLPEDETKQDVPRQMAVSPSDGGDTGTVRDGSTIQDPAKPQWPTSPRYVALRQRRERLQAVQELVMQARAELGSAETRNGSAPGLWDWLMPSVLSSNKS